MDYQEIKNTFNGLKDVLKEKKQAIIKNNVEAISNLDEESMVLCEKIQKYDLEKNSNLLSDEQKKELKELGEEIKKITKNNEILIKHSLDVINGLLSGILNISQKERNSYNSKGQSHKDDSMDISSVIEEA